MCISVLSNCIFIPERKKQLHLVTFLWQTIDPQRYTHMYIICNTDECKRFAPENPVKPSSSEK